MTTNNAETSLAGAELPTEPGVWWRNGQVWAISFVDGDMVSWVRIADNLRSEVGMYRVRHLPRGRWIKATPPAPPESRPLTISDDLPDLLFRRCGLSQGDTMKLAEEIRAMVKAPAEAAEARTKALEAQLAEVTKAGEATYQVLLNTEAERDAHAKDWAETDTAFRHLCESVLSKEAIYGDSYGVPGILDLAVLLIGKAEERDALKAEVERLRRELGEARC